MLDVVDTNWYTVKDLMNGFGWAKTTAYEHMKNGLKWSQVGGMRLISGVRLREYLTNHEMGVTN